jgi:plastocyanin
MRAGLVGLVAAVLVAGAISAVVQPRVIVTDRSLSPKKLTVAAGSRVSWLDRGKLPHTVVSTTRGWPRFTLRPGKTKAVRLARPGRYPYRVDARRSGLIVVVPSPRGAPPYALSHWVGTMHSIGSLPVPGNPCHDEYRTTLSLDVDAGGAVSGTGQATAIVAPTCAIQPPTPPPLTAATLTVHGRATARTLELRLFPGTLTPNPALDGGFFANWVGPAGVDPPNQVVPIVAPGHATGQVTVTDASTYEAGTSANAYDLRCAACRA